MKLKNAFLNVLIFVLVATLTVGGTLAYLTSTDSDVNVMTLGNVQIKQIEEQLAADGTAREPFEQAKALYPNTEVSKIVTVENTGKTDAYFRTLIAFEDLPNSGTFDMSFPIAEGDYVWSWAAPEATIVIDGVTYQVYEALYKKVLKAGETSPASLTKVVLGKTCTNEDMEALGGTYDVLVLSQAVQTAGFADAKTALDTAFGKTSEKAAEWFAGQDIPAVVSTATDTYNSTLESGTVILGADIKTSESDKHYSGNREYAIRDDKEYVLYLNGHTITHDSTYQDGKNTGYTYLYTVAYNSKLTVNGEGTVNSANSEGSASIFYAQSTGEIEINGGNYNVHRGIAVWAGNGSHITINGGSFISTGSAGNEELIYSSGGIIDIYDGFFHNKEWESRPVNVANANRGTGRINIYGGTFVNFDPSTGGDDPNNIKVMEGYKVVSETQTNGDIWYTVVPE